MEKQPGRVLLVEPRGGSGSGPTRRALVDGGFDTHVASDESEALALAAKTAFDVWLVDLDAPGTAKIDGVALMRRIRETSSSASVVWLTARATNDVAVRAAELGVLQVLSKPAKADALRRIVAAGVRQTRDQLSMIRAVMQPPNDPRSVSATDAKNEFGNILDAAVQSGAVVITKHDVPRAVLVSVDRLGALMAKHEPDLSALTREFDDVVAKMRTPSARRSARDLFSASPEAFGEAALAAVPLRHRAGAVKKRAAKRTKRAPKKRG